MRRAKKLPAAPPPRRKVTDPTVLADLIEAQTINYDGEPVVLLPQTIAQDIIDFLRKPPPPMPVSVEVLEAWDAVYIACGRVLTSLPHQMTSAAEDLEAKQKRFHTVLFEAAMARPTEPADG